MDALYKSTFTLLYFTNSENETAQIASSGFLLTVTIIGNMIVIINSSYSMQNIDKDD